MSEESFEEQAAKYNDLVNQLRREVGEFAATTYLGKRLRSGQDQLALANAMLEFVAFMVRSIAPHHNNRFWDEFLREALEEVIAHEQALAAAEAVIRSAMQDPK